LANLACRGLDDRLARLAARAGYVYTRYADDLTFSASGDAARRAGALLSAVQRIVVDEGFTVHPDKVRVLRRSARQEVTGVVVNQGARVPRPTLRRLRAVLHDAERFGLQMANRDKRPDFEAWLRGSIAYVSMIDPLRGQALAEKLDDIVASPPRSDG
jgi:hypothetical protein